MKRIETIERIKGFALMEKVIDRFRRATQPMKLCSLPGASNWVELC